MSTQQKILQFCLTPRTSLEIAAHCGLERISIYTQLGNLKRSNKIEKRGGGRRGSPCTFITIRQAPVASESSDGYENLVIIHAHNPFGLRT